MCIVINLSLLLRCDSSSSCAAGTLECVSGNYKEKQSGTFITPQKFADLKASSVLANVETVLSVALFSAVGGGLFLVCKLSLKLAISWLVSKS